MSERSERIIRYVASERSERIIRYVASERSEESLIRTPTKEAAR